MLARPPLRARGDRSILSRTQWSKGCSIWFYGRNTTDDVILISELSEVSLNWSVSQYNVLNYEINKGDTSGFVCVDSGKCNTVMKYGADKL